jgi:acetyltransferase-like isoleucine patch superfamily enzyme
MTLKPFYDREVQRGNLEIVDVIDDVDKWKNCNDISNFDLVIISAPNDFYRRMKLLEAQSFPRNRILDGRIFSVPSLDFPRFLKERIAYGLFENKTIATNSIMYKRVFGVRNSKTTVTLEDNSFIGRALIEDGVFRNGIISLGKFSAVAWDVVFELGLNGDHNHKNVGQFGLNRFYWKVPPEFYLPHESYTINIGSDVWIGRGCNLKSANSDKPLIIGDGALIASDSVVVKDVPPYAIVGGNPAKIIKYRFEPHIIKALLRIKWWDWSLDKIHDNFKYFNDIEKFISLHDRGLIE